MKKIWKVSGTVLAALFLRGAAQADSGRIVTDGFMPVPPVAAYSSTFSVRTDGMNKLSAQVVVTSVTQASQPFNDGRASTATFTVVSYTALSTATATGNITVSNLGFLASTTTPQCVSGGGPSGTGQFGPVCAGTDWVVTASTGATACALSAAINSYVVGLSTCVGADSTGIVYTSATYGSAAWNKFNINTSSNTTGGALAVVQMTGGQDNATLTVNGKSYQANTDFYPVTSTAQTATNLATAITASSVTYGVVAAAVSNVVYATSTQVGASTTYATASSTQSALTLGPYTSSGTFGGLGAMYGGSNSSYTITGSMIQLATTQNFGLAQGVWLSTTTGNTALSPLVYGTTYYVIPGASGTGKIQLALTSTRAVAGLPIVLTSSAVKTTADVFQLNLPAGVSAASSGIQWAVSNDNSHWVWYQLTPNSVVISSVSYTSNYLGSTGVVNNFDFGLMDYGYLGLSVTASTSAPTNVMAHIIGKE